MKYAQNPELKEQRFIPQQGFTLVELMVALVIGLIITAGVIQIFVTSRGTGP